MPVSSCCMFDTGCLPHQVHVNITTSSRLMQKNVIRQKAAAPGFDRSVRKYVCAEHVGEWCAKAFSLFVLLQLGAPGRWAIIWSMPTESAHRFPGNDMRKTGSQGL